MILRQPASYCVDFTPLLLRVSPFVITTIGRRLRAGGDQLRVATMRFVEVYLFCYGIGRPVERW